MTDWERDLQRMYRQTKLDEKLIDDRMNYLTGHDRLPKVHYLPVIVYRDSAFAGWWVAVRVLLTVALLQYLGLWNLLGL